MTIFQRWKQTALHNKALVITGTIVAVGTLLSTGMVIVQICIIRANNRATSEQTTKLIKAANTQADAANSFATSADDIDDNTVDAVDQFRRLADESKESIKATQDVMRQDQRAWVGLAHVDDLQPFDGDVEHYPKFALRFVNSGKTPATNVVTWVDWQPSETLGPLCTGVTPQSFEAQSIPPQGEFILRDPTENPWYVEDSSHQYWKKQHGAGGHFCVYGEISYADVFFGQARRHATHFCIYAYPDRPERFRYCPTFNDMN